VNGVVADVIGNRFTARHVPLAMGANTIAASASVLGLPVATMSVGVERSDTPVLQVKIFSPPDGATIPGGGLVVRGFASARQSRVLVADRFAPLEEGLFVAEEVDVPAGAHALSAAAQLGDGTTLVGDDVQVTSATSIRALALVANPTTASVPFDATLELQAKVPGVSVTRLDFDLDGDHGIDVAASTGYTVETQYAEARPYVARAYASLPNGAELSAATRIGAYLAPTVTRRFATGNPVDLLSGPGGNLFVLDGAAGTVSRYDRDGDLLDFFGASGSGSGQLSNPQAFAITPDGRFYVADTGNDRIQVFSAAGTFERTIGTSGSGSGQLRRPAGIAVAEDRILVADQGNQRIAVFGLDGSALGPFAGVDARGLVEVSGQGILVASPQSGLLSLVDNAVQSIPRLEDCFAAGELGAPIDVALGDDGVWLADASAARLWSLTDSLGFRRVIDTPTRLPRAVADGLRREVESVYVADGTEVTEIALPTPSPLPVVNDLKIRLVAGDIAGALAQIHPLQRARYGEIYAARGAGLSADAVAMQSFEINLLREDRAIVRVRHLVPVDGTPREYSSPIHLNRAKDGSWLIYDY
jgi:DNA-binding beta-propeller fold protein YncE